VEIGVGVEVGVVAGVIDGAVAGGEQLQTEASIMVKVKIADKVNLSMLLVVILKPLDKFSFHPLAGVNIALRHQVLQLKLMMPL